MKLDYETQLELSVKYGNEAVCGYIRNPKIHLGRS